MDVILIAGFWLDGSSWDQVAPTIRAAGHTVATPTLPGLESLNADRSGIRLRDHIEAIVKLVDATDGPIVLVGHSGGGAIAHAVADARAERIARVVYVDSGPTADGKFIYDGYPATEGEIPLPDWSAFDPAELVGLTDEIRDRMRERAIPQPAAVATDPMALSDDRRYDVPVTVITCTFPADQMVEMIAAGHPWTAELAAVHDVEVVDLPTGHWPQFTKPHELAAAIVEAIATDRPAGRNLKRTGSPKDSRRSEDHG